VNTHRKSFPLQRTQQHRYRDKISSLGPRLLIPKMRNSAGCIENSYARIHRARVITYKIYIETLVVSLGSPLERLRETIHVCNNQSLIEETEYMPTKYTPTTAGLSSTKVAVQERSRRPFLHNNLVSMYSTTHPSPMWCTLSSYVFCHYIYCTIVLEILEMLIHQCTNPSNVCGGVCTLVY
jgi:hypothetical protein